MKKEFIILLSALAFFGCNKTKTEAQVEQIEKEVVETTVGGSKDDHGCLVGAGETWSALRQSCLRLFEEGIRLQPTKEEADSATLSAFVVFNEEQSQLELFLPDQEGKSWILNQKEEKTYEQAPYTYDAKSGMLYIQGELAYQREK